MTERLARLKIQRGGPGEAPAYDDFEVPYRDGMSVLDALIWIRTNKDSSLAIRYSCTNANTCKECMVRVDDKTVYACTKRLGTTPVSVGPLTNKRLLRDLVTDIVPPREKLSLLLGEPSSEE
ncbi:MAG: 2Fe-2S iron-sulfur cluster-binding protein [Rhodospirillales bacterium]|jgi:succinate dehydrogenase/fumarate reductase-like Fe-S protein|nr:2Fe-2S iron-sulfur cluster-binding protein [Rhodospirillales bacterium]